MSDKSNFQIPLSLSSQKCKYMTIYKGIQGT